MFNFVLEKYWNFTPMKLWEPCLNKIFALFNLRNSNGWGFGFRFFLQAFCYRLFDALFVEVDSGLLKELFSTGKQMDPTITRLSNDRLALTRDESTIFIDSNGSPTQKAALSWTSIPIAMGKQTYRLLLSSVLTTRVLLSLRPESCCP